MAATCLETWDFLSLIKLLQSNIFSDKVHRAMRTINDYTRRDIAHERFDLDWNRDWKCMMDLLNALQRPDDAAKLRDFCQSKTHTSDGGERHMSTSLT